VKGWPSGLRAAGRLVEVGLWERVQGGYRFVWIRDQNRPAASPDKAPGSAIRNGASGQLSPLGTYTGDSAGSVNHLRKHTA
jgi:hypothetical protein